MTEKDFRRRLFLSQIYPPLFFMPKKEKKEDPWIFEIEVNRSASIQLLWACSSHAEERLFFNLRDVNGNYVNKQTHPELFHDFPIHSFGIYYPSSFAFTGFLSENLIENDVEVYTKIDWGDGTSMTYPMSKYNIKINGESYTMEAPSTTYPFREDTSYSSNTLNHYYNNPGTYVVKVYGIAPEMSIYSNSLIIQNGARYDTYTGGTPPFRLKRIISWGDLHYRVLRRTFMRAFIDMTEPILPLPFVKMKKVVAMYDLCASNIIISDHYFKYRNMLLNISWEMLGGDDFFHKFPNLVYADGVFRWSTISYIPDYCFSENLYLRSVSGAFAGCFIKYIGKYACANLPELQNGSNFTGIMSSHFKTYFPDDFMENPIEGGLQFIIDNPMFEYIGDGVFENDSKLTEANCVAMPVNYLNYTKTRYGHLLAFYINGWKKIGNNIFKNCGLFTTYKNNQSDGPIFGSCFNLKSIGDSIFENCMSLKALTEFNKAPFLNEIGQNVIKGCSNLESIWVFNGCLFPKRIPDGFYNVVTHSCSICFTAWNPSIDPDINRFLRQDIGKKGFAANPVTYAISAFFSPLTSNMTSSDSTKLDTALQNMPADSTFKILFPEEYNFLRQEWIDILPPALYTKIRYSVDVSSLFSKESLDHIKNTGGRIGPSSAWFTSKITYFANDRVGETHNYVFQPSVSRAFDKNFIEGNTCNTNVGEYQSVFPLADDVHDIEASDEPIENPLGMYYFLRSTAQVDDDHRLHVTIPSNQPFVII